jgi:hypothetical protein
MNAFVRSQKVFMKTVAYHISYEYIFVFFKEIKNIFLVLFNLFIFVLRVFFEKPKLVRWYSPTEYEEIE